MHQGARQRHALLLTAREFFGEGFPTVEQANSFEHVLRLFVGLRARDAVELQRQADIFANGQGGNQVEELEDETDPGAPKESAIAFGQGGQVLTIHPNLPAVRRVDAADQVEQGAFAAAALAQNGGDLAGLEFGMGILQDNAAHIAFVIGFGQVMETEKCSHGCDCILYGLEDYYEQFARRSRTA